SWLFIDRLVIGMSTNAAEQKRIAVRCSMHDAVYADDACSTGCVLNNHLFAQDYAHTGSKDSTDNVERTSRGKRVYHGKRPRWIGLRARRERPSGYTTAEKRDEFPPPHGAYPKAVRITN